MRFIGDLSLLYPRLQRLMAGIEERTAGLSLLNLTVAINYGGRNELMRAARKLADRVARGQLSVQAIDEDMLESCLDTHDLPDPDLVIRTSGETRISNYLLWQSAYSEYEFTPTLWPDFTAAELAAIIGRFGGRERRFGSAAPA